MLFFVIALSCFFFNDTATTEIYTLSLHDALPISRRRPRTRDAARRREREATVAGRLLRHDRSAVAAHAGAVARDRKSTRLNSSHGYISYAVFCLKKKKKNKKLNNHRQNWTHNQRY